MLKIVELSVVMVLVGIVVGGGDDDYGGGGGIGGYSGGRLVAPYCHMQQLALT